MATERTKTVRERRAQFVRAARAYAGCDQAEIADVLGVSANTIKRMERGTRDISMDELKTMAVLYDVPLSFLLEGFAGLLPDGRDLEIAVLEMRDELVARLDRIGGALVASYRDQVENLASVLEGFAPILVNEDHALTREDQPRESSSEEDGDSGVPTAA